jgi:hypothetical protein
MKKMSYWGIPVALFALGLGGMEGFKEPATAVSSPKTTSALQKSEPTSLQQQGNVQVAQGLIGQCRAPIQRIFLYSQRSTSSPTIRTIGPDERVTLADNGGGGWIAISSPEPGYVRASDLTTCQSVTPAKPNPTPNPTPNTTSSLCRIVTYNGPEGGLAIRSRPESTAPRVDGVKFGERVSLRTSPPPSTLDKDGRDWVEVTTPSRGWLSNGFPNSKSPNLGSCS